MRNILPRREMQGLNEDPVPIGAPTGPERNERERWLESCIEHLNAVTNGGLSPQEIRQVTEEYERACDRGKDPEQVAKYLMSLLADTTERPLSTPLIFLEEEVLEDVNTVGKRVVDLGQLITDRKYPEENPNNYGMLKSLTGGKDFSGKDHAGRLLVEIEHDDKKRRGVSSTPLWEDVPILGRSSWTISIEFPPGIFVSSGAGKDDMLHWIASELPKLAKEGEEDTTIDLESILERSKNKADRLNYVACDRLITLMNLGGPGSIDWRELRELDNGNWEVIFDADLHTAGVRNAERAVRCRHAVRFDVEKVQKQPSKLRLGWMAHAVLGLLRGRKS